MIHQSKILVIIGSLRGQRICPQIAHWVAQIGRESTARDIEVIDLKDWKLPMDDEPGIPAVHDYLNDHTKAWSRKIADAGAIVFVAPQYNWGYPAALKNAIDHLYKEWHGKPAMIVSYGHRGGGKCAAQLRQVLNGVHMKPVAKALLRIDKERIKANSGDIDPAVIFARHQQSLANGLQKLDSAMRGPWWRRFSARTSPTG
jgi:NAD(P)H-dependent FMN reductase